MLKEIRLKNFKCFREETIFPLSTINLLTGINGRGKSTLLQSMLLMKQSVEHNEYTNKLILNGNCVNLGTYEDLQNSENALEDNIEIRFKYNQDYYPNSNLDIKYTFDNKSINAIELFYQYPVGEHKFNYEDKLEKISEEYAFGNSIFRSSWLVTTFGNTDDVEFFLALINEEAQSSECISYNILPLKHLIPYIDHLDIDIHNHYSINVDVEKYKDNSAYWYAEISKSNFYSKINYVAADRLGSQEYYKKINLNDFISVDKKGENLATVLFELKESLVNDKLYLGNDAKNLEEQVGEWLSVIFDTSVKIEVKEGAYTFEILFTINGKTHKPTNVGFGYSYILPIIVSGLIAREGEILIIENPEAHLHPKAQSELTKFLAKVASCGVQIFIESHSEHILRGLQVSVLKEDIEINEKDVNILYFHNEKEKDSNFTQIPINADGSIENWPNDFFDQADKDYKILFGF